MASVESRRTDVPVRATTKEPDMAILRTRPAERVPFDSTRRTALVAGVFSVISSASIPTLLAIDRVGVPPVPPAVPLRESLPVA
jgi:hypothetical protein